MIATTIYEDRNLINPQIMHELADYQDTQCPRNSVLYVYGSSAYLDYESHSDIDLLLAAGGSDCGERPQSLSRSFGDFITDLHYRYGKAVDNEVPYENKLVYSHEELNDAVTLKGLIVDEHYGKIIIPPIIKTAAYLGSQAIKLRLALNALTTPQYMFGPAEKITPFMQKAELNTTIIGVGLLDEDRFEAEDVCSQLFVSSTGQVGEMHLGYKPEFAAVSDYVHSFVALSLWRLAKMDLISKVGKGRYKSVNFNPVDAVRQGAVHEQN